MERLPRKAHGEGDERAPQQRLVGADQPVQVHFFVSVVPEPYAESGKKPAEGEFREGGEQRRAEEVQRIQSAFCGGARRPAQALRLCEERREPSVLRRAGEKVHPRQAAPVDGAEGQRQEAAVAQAAEPHEEEQRFAAPADKGNKVKDERERIQPLRLAFCGREHTYSLPFFRAFMRIFPRTLPPFRNKSL